MSWSPQQLVSEIRRFRLRQGTEAALHSDLATALTHLSIDFRREVRLGPADRIDFLCAGGIGIECKVRARRRDTFRQLERYAGYEQIEALILVTGTAMGLPAALAGKSMFYVSLGRSAL